MVFPVAADFAVSQVSYLKSLWVAVYITQSFLFTHNISNGDAAVLFSGIHIISCTHASRFYRELIQRETFPLLESFSSEVKPHSWLVSSPSHNLNFIVVIPYFQEQQWRHGWDWHAFTSSSSQIMVVLKVLKFRHYRNKKIPSLCELPVLFLFIHNFCWINFPPADFILTFSRLPWTFSRSFPSMRLWSPNLVKK